MVLQLQRYVSGTIEKEMHVAIRRALWVGCREAYPPGMAPFAALPSGQFERIPAIADPLLQGQA